ncbi:hypothetical protein EGT74_00325 [Chitinophaga lutea]|uniref:Methylamine utilisation protein MauE domain-containing protein n=1 Tax=Chitinophaga lutea TaxID=2488634 RepID=A0A3N4Q7I6_9BACT|nr:hypothetical protein EGT74_00325 [Chitinophaga lutea]
MKKGFILETLISLLVLLLTYASLSKILEFEKFVFQLGLSPFHLLSSNAYLVALLVPLVEISIIILLMIKRTKLIGLWSNLFLMSIFTVYIAAMLLSGSELPCTCGGIISKMSWVQHLYFNLFFIAASVIAILLIHRKDRDIKVLT